MMTATKDGRIDAAMTWQTSTALMNFQQQHGATAVALERRRNRTAAWRDGCGTRQLAAKLFGRQRRQSIDDVDRRQQRR